MQNRKIKNYFPEPKFQLRFLSFLLAGSIAQITIVCLILYYFISQNYEILVERSGLDLDVTQTLYRELHFLITVLTLSFAGYLVAIMILGVFFSHKIAGVVFALKRTIQQINEGKDAQLTLRKGDQFQELCDSFNHMIRNLKSGERRDPSAKASG